MFIHYQGDSLGDIICNKSDLTPVLEIFRSLIAQETALQGAKGYDTKKKDCRVGCIPGKVFAGFQKLAYYYVSFKLAVPELVDQLGPPYGEEFEMAMKM